ncbi:MAG: ADP-ribosylglycohydrolase family protein [Bacteroidales bacterium]|nr:ADP-ribosylglycohydrolase family protein [Bacteroidales bacterium]
MLGAIIGDIIGSRFEFGGKNLSNFKLFTSECSFTDDTICTIAIAEALTTNMDYKECLLKWCKKYPYPMGGYGSRLNKWLGSTDNKPYDSWGNGSAMRVSPIGWAFDSLAKTEKEAERSAKPTHSHPEGIKGAKCVAMLIYKLRKREILKEEIADWVNKMFEYELPLLENASGVGETCMETVPQAIACFLEANNFENTIRNAIVLGGDTDTTGAIAGAIAEAYYTIPKEIKEQALKYLPFEMKSVIAEFFAKFR